MDNFIALIAFINNLLADAAVAHAGDKAGCRADIIILKPSVVRSRHGQGSAPTVVYEVRSAVYPSQQWFVSGAVLARAEMATSQHDERSTLRVKVSFDLPTTPSVQRDRWAAYEGSCSSCHRAESECECAVGEDQINF